MGTIVFLGGLIYVSILGFRVMSKIDSFLQQNRKTEHNE